MSPERFSISGWNVVNVAAGENHCHIKSLSPFISSSCSSWLLSLLKDWRWRLIFSFSIHLPPGLAECSQTQYRAVTFDQQEGDGLGLLLFSPECAPPFFFFFTKLPFVESYSFSFCICPFRIYGVYLQRSKYSTQNLYLECKTLMEEH